MLTDNGRQFTDKKLERYFEHYAIKHRVTLVEHPQTNGKVEVANKVGILPKWCSFFSDLLKWADSENITRMGIFLSKLPMV